MVKRVGSSVDKAVLVSEEEANKITKVRH